MPLPPPTLWAVYFYPRSPRGERLPRLPPHGSQRVFLSTLPARGASGGGAMSLPPQIDFYPRSPRGERPPIMQGYNLIQGKISIHAPREGSDV